MRTSWVVLCDIWQLAYPAMLRNLVDCGSDRLTLSLVGHYDPHTAHFDGAGMGTMYSNLTGLSIGKGLCMGLALLCSQAHGADRGTENPGHLRRCSVVLLLAYVYTVTTAACCAPALKAFGSPAAVADASARFAQILALGQPGYWSATAIQVILDSMGRTRAGMYSSMVGGVTQVTVAVLAVSSWGLDWGYLGEAAARSVGGYVSLGVLIAYVRYHG